MAFKQYGPRWERARRSYLSSYPLCVMCLAYGRVELAVVVDHIKPHKGDQVLFWDKTNWQGLCSTHHSSDARQVERGYRSRHTVGVDGWAVDEPPAVKEMKKKKNPSRGEVF